MRLTSRSKVWKRKIIFNNNNLERLRTLFSCITLRERRKIERVLAKWLWRSRSSWRKNTYLLVQMWACRHQVSVSASFLMTFPPNHNLNYIKMLLDNSLISSAILTCKASLFLVRTLRIWAELLADISMWISINSAQLMTQRPKLNPPKFRTINSFTTLIYNCLRPWPKTVMRPHYITSQGSLNTHRNWMYSRSWISCGSNKSRSKRSMWWARMLKV